MKNLKVNNLKKVLSFVGITMLLCNSVVLFITFLSAYFNNGSITIYINTINEANIELILIPLSIVLGFYALKRCHKYE